MYVLQEFGQVFVDLLKDVFKCMLMFEDFVDVVCEVCWIIDYEGKCCQFQYVGCVMCLLIDDEMVVLCIVFDV